MSDLSKKMRSLFDTWPRALPYAVKNSDDVGLHEQAAAAAILNRHRATPRQDLLALCAEIETLESKLAVLEKHRALFAEWLASHSVDVGEIRSAVKEVYGL